jgi:hypothetical protein
MDVESDDAKPYLSFVAMAKRDLFFRPEYCMT